MTVEGQDVSGKSLSPEVDEVQPDKEGKYPEVVPWSKYVGIKQSLGNKLDAERDKVKNLEEQLKNAPNVDEHSKLAQELETTKTQLQAKEAELSKIKEATVSELSTALIAKGVAEDQVKEMSEAEMKRMLTVLGGIKPKSLPDLSGSGGGSGVPQGTPMELSRQAYSRKSK